MRTCRQKSSCIVRSTVQTALQLELRWPHLEMRLILAAGELWKLNRTSSVTTSVTALPACSQSLRLNLHPIESRNAFNLARRLLNCEDLDLCVCFSQRVRLE
ncbi:uncharacterized protein HKW66_Vig0007720 [Vigna angularis]|uniref:Uncharacterized protein n=1 Tax=Phaseolus angularis TaxID=3914 RepID=A0A8T0LDL6_PHAAN|nr:uncharacterized protein HKW66_Vig0007720 [Vigna angularis]